MKLYIVALLAAISYAQTEQPETPDTTTLGPGCVATELCTTGCPAKPTTCEEFEAMTAVGGCAASCCESFTKPYKDALCGEPAQCLSWETEIYHILCWQNLGTTPKYYDTSGCWLTRRGTDILTRVCCEDCSRPAPTSTTDPFTYWEPTYTTTKYSSWSVEDEHEDGSSGTIILTVFAVVAIFGCTLWICKKRKEHNIQSNRITFAHEWNSKSVRQPMQGGVRSANAVNQSAETTAVIQIKTPPPESPIAYKPESPPAYQVEPPLAYKPESPPAYQAEPPLVYKPETPPVYQAEPPAYEVAITGTHG